MKKLFTILMLVAQVSWAQPVIVAQVIDGDTFITQQGKHVRLLGINTPETAKQNLPAQPGAAQAKKFTQNLIENKTLTLQFGERKKDKYKRLLAHAYLPDGTWVNGALVENGLAHVYSFKDNRTHLPALQKKERQARAEKKGIWAYPRWQVLQANQPFPDNVIGHFNLVEGVVQNVVNNKKTTYLNFGTNWRTDFTVEIRPQDKHNFKGVDYANYKNQKVLVRGFLKPVNGVLVTATHPEQIEKIE